MSAPSSDSDLLGTLGSAYKGVKDALVGTFVAPVANTIQPTAAAVTPTTAPESSGYTSTGGRRHRKTRALRSKRRSTRKTMRRHRRGGEVDDSNISTPDLAFQYAKSKLRKVTAPLGGKHRRKGKKGSRKH